MEAQLPDLHLMQYIANKIFFCKNLGELPTFTEFQEKYKKLKENSNDDYGRVFLEFEYEMFKQTWPNTACGIDCDKNGERGFAGQAFTDAYTTVIHEHKTNCYLVFFGENVAYSVHDPTDEFYKDLKEHKLKSLSQAKGVY